LSLFRIQLGLIIIGFLLIFGPSIPLHYDNASNPYRFNDDVRQQIAPFVLLNHSVPPSYSSEYYLNVFSPPGFRLLYQWGGKLIDPRTISKTLPYLLALAFYIIAGISAYRLGGLPGSTFTILLLLSADIFIARMVGGLPRSFAFPCLAATALALIEGRAIALSSITLLGIAFYPTAGLISFLSLFLLLFALPARFRADVEKWGIKKRILILIGVAIVSIGIALPQIHSGGDYGERIGIEKIAEFPEAGPGGRYSESDRPPFSLFHAIFKYGALSFYGGGEALFEIANLRYTEWMPSALNLALVFSSITIILGFKVGWTKESAFPRAFLLLPASLIGYLSADILYPYLFLPDRFIVYAFPVFILILFPACLLELLKHKLEANRKKWATGIASIFLSLIFIVLGGTGNGFSGYSIRADNLEPLYKRIERLPEKSLIAGWPGGPVENIPYLSSKNIFISYETHQAFHEKYALEMRRRMNALISMYFAADESALADIRDQFKVGFLLIDLRRYKEKPNYFKPFDKTIDEVFKKNEGKGFYLEKNHRLYKIFQLGSWALLDLSRIGSQTKS